MTWPVYPPGKGPGEPLIQDALQDYINFIYNKAAQDLLQREIGKLGERLDLVNEALQALNKINSVATTPISKANLSYEDIASSAAEASLWQYRSMLIEGFSVLSFMLKNTPSYQLIPTTELAYISDVVVQLRHTASEIHHGTEAAAKTAILSWFNGLGGSEKEWSVQTNLVNAIQQFEFLNTGAENQLREAMFVFREFADSASMSLSKLNRIYHDIGRQIG